MRYSNWQNKAGLLWIAMTLVLAMVLGVMYTKDRIHVQSDIFKLLPNISDNADVRQSQKTLSEHLNRQVFVMLQANDDEDRKSVV